MPKVIRSHETNWKHQADAVLNEANPVSGAKYVVLDTTKNVRVKSIVAKITWATTQPTPLQIHVTIDGVPMIYGKVNPVTATWYEARLAEEGTALAQYLSALGTYAPFRAFLLEGKSVKVEAEITWATTQPTPLECRLKYGKKV